MPTTTTRKARPPSDTRVLRAVADVAAAQARPAQPARTPVLIGAAVVLAALALFGLVIAGLVRSSDLNDQLAGLRSLLTTSIGQGQQLSDQVRALGQTPVVTPLPPQVVAQAGVAGKDGAPGQAGLNGRDGVTPACVSTPTQCVGKDGIAGKDGADGQPGKDGVAGKDGKDGSAGPAGPPSPPAQITQHYADGSSSVCTRDPGNPGPDTAPNYSCPAPTSAPPTSVEMP